MHVHIDECLILAVLSWSQGLGAVPPDWMKAEQYNGTDTINVCKCIRKCVCMCVSMCAYLGVLHECMGV